MTLVRRRITLQFQLGLGAFGESGVDTIEVSGVRVSASLSVTGGITMTQLDLRVFGLQLDVMNKLTILSKQLVTGRFNTVIVNAGDEGGPLSVVFAGTIREAWVDATGSPQVAFILVAQDGAQLALKPVVPVSFKGSVDVAQIISYIARTNNLGFENGGVSAQATNAYVPSTALEQIQALGRHYNFNTFIQSNAGFSNSGTVVIWPFDTPRPGPVPVISPETGLIGYPMRTQSGIMLRTLFNPAIVFGGQIQVQSALTPVNGTWNVFSINHDLESETPGGKWFTTIDCSLLGAVLPIAGGGA